MEGEPYGTLNAFPFALFKRDGGWVDWVPVEDITIRSRLAHAPLAANAALPYYPGEYVVMITDYGQTIDFDLDGCGDNFGYGFDPDYDPAADPDCSGGTLGIPLMGVYSEPQLYIWKDGVIKLFVEMGFQAPGDPCNAHWWKAASISSGVSGIPTYTPINVCGDVPGIAPYFALTEEAALHRLSAPTSRMPMAFSHLTARSARAALFRATL